MSSPKIREAPTSPSAAGRGVVTDTQRRILEGFADRKVRWRHTKEEWDAERDTLVEAGWIDSGIAIAGAGHFITDAVRTALRLELLK